MKKRIGQENFLEFIPIKNTNYSWDTNKKGRVEISMENKGFFNKIAQILFKKPKVSYIEFDEFGSYIWSRIDGKRDVYAIGQDVKAKFGDQAEPLYTRLCSYVKTLKNHKFVMLMKKPEKGE